ncbi:MAG: hypothetical protein NC099_06020 [Corallococcus sp.]|nr:hypothetical protein [Bacillota bacterium]MCM1534190.1 hypothetical protein [Corallococcus sp.]
MSFDKNIGEYLASAFKNGQAAHAYVIVGEKQHLPNLLRECALVAMCREHNGHDNCDTCGKVKQGIHQDVAVLPRDAQKDRITIADVAYLVEESAKRPIDNGERRVFLINASNSVTGIGSEIWQNKLLKTLEEPPDGIYIFIGVSDAEGLLPTVRSRCQILRQSKFSVAEVKQALRAKGFDERSCEMAAAMSGGSVYSGERLLATPQIFRAYETAVDTASNMTSTKNALKFASEIIANRDYVTDFLGFYALLLAESITYRLQPKLCMLPSFTDNIDKICSNYTLSAATACIERLNEAKRQLDNGANVSITVDVLLNEILQLRYLCRE